VIGGPSASVAARESELRAAASITTSTRTASVGAVTKDYRRRWK
jgi:hypothetical protein